MVAHLRRKDHPRRTSGRKGSPRSPPGHHVTGDASSQLVVAWDDNEPGFSARNSSLAIRLLLAFSIAAIVVVLSLRDADGA